jgi:rod shape-determining protein MreB
LAAALGMGLNIQEPEGKMIVDIGGGVTEIVIISLSGIASFESLKVSGDTMDSDIRDHFRRKYNMGIGLKTAEQIKITTGAVIEDIAEVPAPMMVKGKDMVRGIPVTRKIGHQEVSNILEKSVNAIERAIIQTLEKCPPELAADIYQNGIHVTGGNALLRGLQQRLQSKIKVPISIDDNALLSVTKGIAQVLRDPVKYRGILLH